MKKKWMLILAILFAGALAIGPIMSNVEIPDYQVLESENSIEIRKYPPIIIAEVNVEGPRKEAIAEGFRLLADYIFGNNTIKQEISMTAPVEQQNNHKIAMTAPVQQQFAGQSWNISFVMPSKYTLKTLPKPNDERVLIKEIESKRFVVIRFSGSKSDENIEKYEKQLIKHIKQRNITITGSPKYAFYNPPWTLPPMRRNEIMFEIKD